VRGKSSRKRKLQSKRSAKKRSTAMSSSSSSSSSSGIKKVVSKRTHCGAFAGNQYKQSEVGADRHSPKKLAPKPQASNEVVADSPKPAVTVYKAGFVPATSTASAERPAKTTQGGKLSLATSQQAEETPKPPKEVNVKYYFTECNRGVEQHRWPLELGVTYSIGSQLGSADIKLNHIKISRLHCNIKLQVEDGSQQIPKLTISDLKSSNGTVVVPQVGVESKKLKPGETVTIPYSCPFWELSNKVCVCVHCGNQLVVIMIMRLQDPKMFELRFYYFYILWCYVPHSRNLFSMKLAWDILCA